MRTLQFRIDTVSDEMRLVIASTKPFVAKCCFCGIKADIVQDDSGMYVTHTQYPCKIGKHRFEVSI